MPSPCPISTNAPPKPPIDLHWYVGYTRPRCEKKLWQKLEQAGVEVFLPLNKSEKYWSDRKKVIEEPLFPNYIFIRVSATNRWFLTNYRELVRFVSFEAKPAVVRQEEIDLIRCLLAQNVKIERSDTYERKWEAGQSIVVREGPFKGLKGFVMYRERNHKVIVNIDTIRQTLILHLSAHQIESMKLNSEACQ